VLDEVVCCGIVDSVTVVADGCSVVLVLGATEVVLVVAAVILVVGATEVVLVVAAVILVVGATEVVLVVGAVVLVVGATDVVLVVGATEVVLVVGVVETTDVVLVVGATDVVLVVGATEVVLVVMTLGGGNCSASSIQLPLTHKRSEAFKTDTLSLLMSDLKSNNALVPFVLFGREKLPDTSLSTNFTVSKERLVSFFMRICTSTSPKANEAKCKRSIRTHLLRNISIFLASGERRLNSQHKDTYRTKF
jgi:hypothetical protein